MLYYNIQDKLLGETSDHLIQSIEIKSSDINIYVFTWNLLNKCFSKSIYVSYSNNPYNINETCIEYKKRKYKQINIILKNIKEGIKKKYDNTIVNYSIGLLQEADYFYGCNYNTFKIVFPYLDNIWYDIFHELSNYMYVELIKIGWKIVLAPLYTRTKLNVIIFDTQVFTEISQVKEILPNENKSYHYGIEIDLNHNKTNNILSVSSIHLDYTNSNSAFEIYYHQLEKIQESKLSIIGGDTNTPSNYSNMYNLIGNYLYASNIDMNLKSGEITNIDRRNNKIKKYDGFFVSPQNINSKIIVKELQRYYWLIENKKLSIELLDDENIINHNYVSPVGKPWLKNKFYKDFKIRFNLWKIKQSFT